MAKYKLLLPKMGESVAEATIIKWNKNIGDIVDIDDAVIDIATDKVDSEVPSPVKGKLVLQLCQENEVVQVGAVLAIIETEEAEAPLTPEQTEAIKNFKLPTGDNGNGHEEEILPDVAPEIIVPFTEQLDIPPAKPVVQASGSRFYSPLVRNIASHEGITNEELDTIPGSGTEGRLTKDDVLAYVNTRGTAPAKPVEPVAPSIPPPVMPVPPPTLSPVPPPAITNGNGTPRPSEALEQPKFITEATPVPPPSLTPVAPPMVLPVPPPTVSPVAPPTASPVPPPIANPVAPPVESPAAATEQPKPASAAQPEQPKAAAPSTPPPAKSVSGGNEIIEMDRMRRLIADHMVASVHTSPHVTSFVEADVTNLVQWRDKIKGPFEKREGTKITFMPIFIEAVAKAIKDYPMINVSVNGTQIIKKKDINIGMAAALPSGNLIVPVIRKADELNLIGLSQAVNDLANRARTSKLLPDEIREGTFTITNVGSFGNDMGTPIINQPQVAILAVGAIKKKPAVIETPTGDAIAIRNMMFLSLSYDHRVVDGALGGSFIRRVADYLENWDLDREI